jgi:hypothetical protein
MVITRVIHTWNKIYKSNWVSPPTLEKSAIYLILCGLILNQENTDEQSKTK